MGDIRTPDIGNGKWADHIDLAGFQGTLTGRDGFGHAGTLDFTGLLDQFRDDDE